MVGRPVRKITMRAALNEVLIKAKVDGVAKVGRIEKCDKCGEDVFKIRLVDGSLKNETECGEHK
jgi:hypothetical protein